MVNELREVHDSGFKYATLIRELHALTLLLEEEPLSLKAIATFNARSDVKAAVDRLRAAFPDQTNE